MLSEQVSKKDTMKKCNKQVNAKKQNTPLRVRDKLQVCEANRNDEAGKRVL